MSENKKIIAVHKSREILLDILYSRGLDTSEYSGFNINEIHAMVINNQLDILLKSKNEGSTKKVYVKYYLDKKIVAQNLYDIIEDLFNIESILDIQDDLVIIIKDEPNDTLKNLQRTIFEHDNIYVTIINIERLQFNITKHSLVPTHRILTEKETKDFRTKYNIVSDKNIPEISRFEPISQVMGIRPGEIFEITRASKTSINSLFYRICSQ